jgi:hypothetical protein
MTGHTDRWIKLTTIACVAMLALIAGTVSYLHMHMHMHMHLLVERHGQPGWVAALTPLSVDGMIVAASTTLLAASRGGSRGRIPALGVAGRGQRGELGRERGGRGAYGNRPGDRRLAIVRSYWVLRAANAADPRRAELPTTPASCGVTRGLGAATPQASTSICQWPTGQVVAAGD